MRWGEIVRLDPAEGFRWGVEEFRLLCKGEPNGEVICKMLKKRQMSG